MDVTTLVGGLALFLYSLESISSSLIKASIDKVKNKLTTLTKSFKSSFFTGFISTILIQSSSALIMLTIALINANLLTFNSSVGIVLGSNIATTISSLLFGINIEKISSILLLITLFITRSKNKKISSISKVFFYVFLLFFSLKLISSPLSSLKENPLMITYIKKSTSNFILSLIIGTLLTASLQSSSLFVALLQVLALNNIIDVNEAIPLIFGANIGTSFDALITLFTGNKESKKLAHFSILFNLSTSIFFSIFILPFKFIINSIISFLHSPAAMSIAIINTTFNILGVLLVIPFIKKIKRYYSKW